METEVLITNEFHYFLKSNFSCIDDTQFIFRKTTITKLLFSYITKNKLLVNGLVFYDKQLFKLLRFKKNDVLFYVDISKIIKRFHFKICFLSKELYGLSDSLTTFFNIPKKNCWSEENIDRYVKMYLLRNNGFYENISEDEKISYDESLYAFLKVNQNDILTVQKVKDIILSQHITKIIIDTKLKSTKRTFILKCNKMVLPNKNQTSTFESFK